MNPYLLQVVLQVLVGPLLVLRFTPWQGWTVVVLSLEESLVEATGSQTASQRGRVPQKLGLDPNRLVFWLCDWPFG